MRSRLVPSLLLLLACGRTQEDAPGPSAFVSLAKSASGESPAASAPAAASSESGDDEAPRSPSQPLVDLSGKYYPPPPDPGSGPKLAVRAMSAPVYAKPNTGSRVIGYLRAGAVLEADATDFGTSGCPGGMRGIKPNGYVCLGDKVTTNLDDPIVKASSRRPDLAQKLPYMYGTVTRGGPLYGRVPSAGELDKLEPNLDKHIKKWKNDEVSGASYGLELWHKWSSPPAESAWESWENKTSTELPPFLSGGAFSPNLSGQITGKDVKVGQVDRRQGMAFVDSFLHEGRRYNVAVDLRLAPADRYRPIKGSDHHGVRIGVDIDFPFALVKKKGGKKYIFSASKKQMIDDGDLPYRAALPLTGKQQIVKGVLHYETKEGYWVDDRHASRLDPAKRMPKWGKNGEKWLDVNITKQTLVAFEGEKAVYATLVSTGEDGLLEGERATKKGIFRVHTKHVTYTMDSDTVGEEFELRDVPYVQFFEGGYALHGAYWHDSFGTPKSHGCINLAPEDARRLFHWTEPSVPANWHGAAKPLTGTVLFIHP